ncbi:MAG: hypothetical protein RI967_1297 [Planctomycetota bacterium]
MNARVAVTAAFALASAGAALAGARNASPAPAESGYSGIDIVAREGFLEVRSIRPGPLDGGHVVSSSLARGDRITSIDGAPASESAWRAAHERAPGETVTIGYRRAGEGEDAPLRTVAVTLDDPSIWRGSWRSADLAPHARPAHAATEISTAVERARGALGPLATARAEALARHVAAIPESHRDPRTPPLLREVLAAPTQAADLVAATLPTAARWRESPFRAAAEFVARASANDPALLAEPQGTFAIGHADAGVWYLDFLLNEARVKFESTVPAGEALAGDLHALAAERLDSLMVRGPRAREAMIALRGIDRFGPAEAARVLAHFDVIAAPSPEFLASEAVELPDALAGAVEGAILAASEIPELGWLVVGGADANRYDLGRVAAILDIGGDDRYDWRHDAGMHRLVVDLAGDDHHEGGARLGPAGALGAVAVIDDRAGDDLYRGGAFTAGASLGLSVLLDRAGDDRYESGAWSLGASTGGAALVIDLDGDDRARSDGMGMGVGGPVGVGAFVDVAGNDLAELGTRPSVYGVAGEHAGFGMGLGLGFRLSSAGGVGYFVDEAGDDIRRSGEFSQGCGYFLGLGVLVDGAGDDTVVCDRYGLGSAAHQAAGVAIDRAGRDSYLTRTAAHLGGAWDESVAFFLDLAGDDTYRTGGLSLGGAAQQAIAIMVDAAGDDAYLGGGATLGEPSSNDYHFGTTGLGSLALFLDLAGRDHYPARRRNGTVVPTPDEASPELGGRDGVFVDEDPTNGRDAGGATPAP